LTEGPWTTAAAGKQLLLRLALLLRGLHWLLFLLLDRGLHHCTAAAAAAAKAVT
jgi:hypothetical protein